jgi:hypothetical protein
LGPEEKKMNIKSELEHNELTSSVERDVEIREKGRNQLKRSFEA